MNLLIFLQADLILSDIAIANQMTIQNIIVVIFHGFYQIRACVESAYLASLADWLRGKLKAPIRRVLWM